MATAFPTFARARPAAGARVPASLALAPSAPRPSLASYAGTQRRLRWPLVLVLAIAHAVVVAIVATDTTSPRATPRHDPLPVTILPTPKPKPPPEVKPKPLPVKRVAPMPVVEPPPVVLAEIPREVVLPAITVPPDPPLLRPIAPPIPVPVATVAAAPAIAAFTPPRFDAAYLDNPPPAYPTLSRRHHEEGRVLLRVRVGADGRAESVDVAASSGFERLDRAAIDAVRRWRFAPARRGDAAVAAEVNVPISFSLDRA